MLGRLNRRVLLKWVEATYNDLLMIPIHMLESVVGPLIGSVVGVVIGGKFGRFIGSKLCELNRKVIFSGQCGDRRSWRRRFPTRLSAAVGATVGSALGASLGALAGHAVGEMVASMLGDLLWELCMWFVDIATAMHKITNDVERSTNFHLIWST